MYLASNVPWLQMFPGFKCTLAFKSTRSRNKEISRVRLLSSLLPVCLFPAPGHCISAKYLQTVGKIENLVCASFVKYTLKVLEILCFELALWACISTNPRYVHDHQLLYHTAREVKRSRHRVQISCTPSPVTQPTHPSYYQNAVRTWESEISA